MGFGDSNFLQKAIDSILGGDDSTAPESPTPSDSSGSDFSVSKSLFGSDDDQPEADATPEPAEDMPMEPHAVLQGALETLVIWALDDARQPMARAPYRLRVGDDVRLGHADENGRIEELAVRPSEICVLSWGEPMDGTDGFSYVRELYWDMDEVDDVDDRRLYNLAYFGDSAEERLAQFQADYQHGLDVVHENGSDQVTVAHDADDANDSDEAVA